MLDILKWIGVPGVIGLVGVAYLLPSLLPGFVVRAVLACVEAAMAALGWLLSTMAAGLQHIAMSTPAVTTLVVVMLAAGVIGDRWDPLRSQLPAWLRSAPPRAAVLAPATSGPDPALAATKPAPRRRTAQRAPSFEADPMHYVLCQLGGGC